MRLHAMRGLDDAALSAATFLCAKNGRPARRLLWACAIACALLLSMDAGARAAPGGDRAAAKAASAPTPAAECDGHPLLTNHVPVAVPVDLPSGRLGQRGSVPFPSLWLPPVDVQALLDEDAAREAAGQGMPPRIGTNRDLDASVTGQWHDLPDGGRLWTAAVVSEGALRMRLHFTDVNLPPGAEVYVYAPDNLDGVNGPYTETGPSQTGDFWTGIRFGDTLNIEYYVLGTDATDLPFDIPEIAHIYRSPNPPDGGGGRTSWTSCMPRIACYPEWVPASYSVARMEFQSNDPPNPPGTYLCTGTLLATSARDQTPYFLTSAHCVDEADEATSLDLWWHYQYANCTGGTLMQTHASYTSEVLSTSGQSSGADYSLLMLKGVLPATNMFWSGWTSVDPAVGSWAVSIHHPDSLRKRYSRGKRYSSGTYYHQLRYNVSGAIGHIYFGSSGGGIWTETDQKLFGNASYGAPAVEGCKDMNNYGYYGRFAQYYPTISNWLIAGSDDGWEQNDSCAAAAAINSGNYSNLVVKSLDEDWYKFFIEQNDQLIVDLTFTDSWGNINAQLYDACGGSVVASATTPSNNEHLTYTNSGADAEFFLRIYLADDVRNTYDMDIAGAWIDDRPPTPNPPTFEVPVTPVSTTEVTMTATECVDATPPVEYFFLYWPGDGNGGDNRFYDPARAYNDNGLDVNEVYTYSVKTRDSADPINYSADSLPSSGATFIEMPAGISFGAVDDTSIEVTADGAFTNLTVGSSGIFFEMTPDEGTGANTWVQTETITVTGLSLGTEYTFRVKSRNQDGAEMAAPWVGPAVQSTTGAAPCALLGDMDENGQVQGNDIGGFVRAKLGLPPEPGENQACASYGGPTLEDDIAAFVADLTGP